jgi:hypothetical protein
MMMITFMWYIALKILIAFAIHIKFYTSCEESDRWDKEGERDVILSFLVGEEIALSFLRNAIHKNAN